MTHANGVVFRGTREMAPTNDEWSRRVRGVLTETAFGVGQTPQYAERISTTTADVNVKNDLTYWANDTTLYSTWRTCYY